MTSTIAPTSYQPASGKAAPIIPRRMPTLVRWSPLWTRDDPPARHGLTVADPTATEALGNLPPRPSRRG